MVTVIVIPDASDENGTLGPGKCVLCTLYGDYKEEECKLSVYYLVSTLPYRCIPDGITV